MKAGLAHSSWWPSSPVAWNIIIYFFGHFLKGTSRKWKAVSFLFVALYHLCFGKKMSYFEKIWSSTLLSMWSVFLCLKMLVGFWKLFSLQICVLGCEVTLLFPRWDSFSHNGQNKNSEVLASCWRLRIGWRTGGHWPCSTWAAAGVGGTQNMWHTQGRAVLGGLLGRFPSISTKCYLIN